MFTTAYEAREKWCPFVRVSTIRLDRGGASTALAVNRTPYESSGVHPLTRCIASDCMAWRWDGTAYDPHSHGYCGLADKPVDGEG